MSVLGHSRAEFNITPTPGAGPACLMVSESMFEAARHFCAPASRQVSSLEREFAECSRAWRHETRFSSSFSTLVMNANYQRIIGLGQDALPFLLRAMEDDPDHWGWALQAITGANPVPDEHVGDIGQIARDWLEWARQRGIGW